MKKSWLEKALESLRIHRIKIGVFHCDLAAAHEIQKRAIHVHHSLLAAGFDDDVDLVGALFADEVCHCIVIDEKLVCRNKPAGNARDEALRKNADERARELRANLVLLRSREAVDD